VEDRQQLMILVLLNVKKNAVLQMQMEQKVMIALQIAQNHVTIRKTNQVKLKNVILNVLNRVVQVTKKNLVH
tara:strand:- start:1401 stop:1616 length:216 start_codon:yes stop_codon:yes gene_type:complete